MTAFRTSLAYACAAWFAIPAFLVCACGGRDLAGVRGSFGDAGGQAAGGDGAATNGGSGSGGASPVLGSGASGGGAISGPPGESSPTVTEPPSDAAVPEPVFVAPVATRLVDDMLHLAPDGPGMTGAWGTYSDRAVSWSEPPILTSDAGSLVPADSTPVFAVTDGGGPVYEDAAQPYRRFSRRCSRPAGRVPASRSERWI